MKEVLRLLIALLIVGSCMALAACAQEQIALSIYVHEGNINGTIMLSGVQVTGQDAKGNSLTATSDENGVAVLKGQPGTWQMAFNKADYQPLELTYDAVQTEEVVAYLEKAVSSNSITLTLYVYEGSMNGTALSGVLVSGKDAAGSEFTVTTNADGTAALSGTPGSWELTLTKAGYTPVVNLEFETTESEDLGAYLEKIA
jgi:phosphatidate phosphatase APP1